MLWHCCDVSVARTPYPIVSLSHTHVCGTLPTRIAIARVRADNTPQPHTARANHCSGGGRTHVAAHAFPQWGATKVFLSLGLAPSHLTLHDSMIANHGHWGDTHSICGTYLFAHAKLVR